MWLGQGDRGYAMAALLVGMSIMAVLLSAALPVWSHVTRREKEEELIWRGQQYARAIGLFQRKFANTFPPNVDVLVEQRFLRKKYKDPITGEDFQVIPAGGAPPGAGGPTQPPGQTPPGTPPGQNPTSPGGMVLTPMPGAQPPRGGFGAQPPTGGFGTAQPSIGIQGVVSKSSQTSIRMYNGRTKYNEWAFVNMATTQRLANPEGGPPPGAGGPGGPGIRPPGGGDRRPTPGNPSRPSSPFPPPRPFGQPQTRPPGR